MTIANPNELPAWMMGRLREPYRKPSALVRRIAEDVTYGNHRSPPDTKPPATDKE
jgi:hypothetical protein